MGHEGHNSRASFQRGSSKNFDKVISTLLHLDGKYTFVNDLCISNFLA